MWDLGNRGFVVFVSVLSGCVFLYNVWGPILVVTISLFLVVYACYSLIVNDSLLAPHALYVFEYCRQISLELLETFNETVDRLSRHVRAVWSNQYKRYRERSLHAMEGQRRRSSYQLSADTYPDNSSVTGSSGCSSGYSLIGQFSPISRTAYKPLANVSGSEGILYQDSDSPLFGGNSFAKHTSTPAFRTKKGETADGDFEIASPDGSARLGRASPLHLQNHTLSRGENTTCFSPDGSPWGNSISPKMRPKAAGVKTVQTVAGPLLASTRYNIDPKVYSDVTSPGLTTRLSKYATDANNKLTHQSQYYAGQFPKVNLGASPIPLINSKSIKARTSVTVRVAPPDTRHYSSPTRQKIFSNICGIENKLLPSVAQEISLKRHASRENVTTDLAKKQRTDVIIREGQENLDEAKPKRSRDESSKSEEECSPQTKMDRPTKRSKTPSCYDILNSLSSSIHVASGVKRKANFSHGGTPDIEKHFKSLKSVLNSGAQQTSPEIQSTKPVCQKQDFKEKINSSPGSPVSPREPEARPAVKGILKTTGKDKLVDKLFMRAEPERNEKLKQLVEEQGSIKANFTTADREEIKKEDIVNMRQTSMKARLQSMFDAISGKAARRINPDVVIQAEEVNVVAPNESSCATLNSSTTTTSVNTVPISISAVVPDLSAIEPATKPSKHVAFNIPPKEGGSTLTNPAASNLGMNIPGISTANTKPPSDISAFVMASTTTTATTTSAVSTGVSSAILSASNFTFGKQQSNVPASNSPNSVCSPVVSTSTVTSLAPPTSHTAQAVRTMDGRNNFSATVTTRSNVDTSQSLKCGLENNISPATTNVSGMPAISLQNAVAATGVTKLPVSSCPLFDNSSVPISSSAPLSFKSSVGLTLSNPSTATSTNTVTPLFSFGSKTGNMETSKNHTLVSRSMGVDIQKSAATNNATIGMGQFATPKPQSASNLANLANPSFNAAVNNSSSTPERTAATNAFTFGTPAKPLFSFGASGSASATTPSTLIATDKATVSAGIFSNANAVGSSAFGISPPTTQFGGGNTSIFGSTSNTSVFGATNAQPAAGTSSGTSGGFGGASGSTGGSMFGSNSNTSAVASTTTAPATFTGNANTSSSTGTATMNENLFANTCANTSNTMSSSIFGQAKSTPGFGSVTPLHGTGSPSLFGSPVTTTSATFGTTSAANITAASTFSATNIATPAFGASRNMSASTTQNSTPQSFGSNTNMFGNGSSSTMVFGSASTVSTFNSPSNNAFGGQSTTNLSFGTTGNATAFGDNKSSLFGTQATTAPAFGAPSTSATPTFGNPTSATPVFRPSNVPTATAFGIPTTSATPGFGTPSNSTASTAAVVPSPGPTPNPISNPTSSRAPAPATASVAGFGVTGTSTGVFGTTGTASTTFGAASTTTPSFGGANSATVTGTGIGTGIGTGTATATFGPSTSASGNTTANDIFTFGGHQKPLQQTTAFTFTGNNNIAANNAAPSTSASFQFGATAPNSGTGFNFSAPSATPNINFGGSGTPSFSAATPGMFSIGTGYSISSRPRNARQRKQR